MANFAHLIVPESYDNLLKNNLPLIIPQKDFDELLKESQDEFQGESIVGVALSNPLASFIKDRCFCLPSFLYGYKVFLTSELKNPLSKPEDAFYCFVVESDFK